MAQGSSFFYHQRDPLFLSAACLLSVLVIQLMALAGNVIGLFNTEAHFYWTISAVFCMVATVAHAVFLLSATNLINFVSRSIISYGALLASLIFLSSWTSRLKIDEVQGAFRWIFFVLTFAYLIILTISLLIRKIVSFAQKQDKKLTDEE